MEVFRSTYGLLDVLDIGQAVILHERRGSPMTIRAQKQMLRREVIARILGLTCEDRERQEARLIGEFGRLPGFHEAKTAMLYVASFAEEIATRPFLQHVLNLGKTLILPRVNMAEKKLELIAVEDVDRDLIVEGRLRIPEPATKLPRVAVESIDWILVPGIAFDATGARLGRGGGYYDRLLPQLRPQTPRWTILYDEQWVDRIPMEPHDARVSGLLSSSRMIHTTY